MNFSRNLAFIRDTVPFDLSNMHSCSVTFKHGKNNLMNHKYCVRPGNETSVGYVPFYNNTVNTCINKKQACLSIRSGMYACMYAIVGSHYNRCRKAQCGSKI